MAAAGVDAVVVMAGPLTHTPAQELVQLTARTRLPAIYGRRDYGKAGRLRSDRVGCPDLLRRAARKEVYYPGEDVCAWL
jgi:hypothetical protein